MQRRRFIQATPAIATCGALTSSTEARASSEATQFERIAYETFQVDVSTGVVPVEHHTISCPFEQGSILWMPISGYREKKDRTVISVATEDGQTADLSTRLGRVVFSRLPEAPEGTIRNDGHTARERVLLMAEHVMETGWLDVPPSDLPESWKVVWVEFHCNDGGLEHIIAGLPVHWSSEIPLHVMVQTRVF